MGSIFDIPSGLLFVLSLVTTNPSDVTTAATGLALPKSVTALNLRSAPCRHGEQAWFAALNAGAGGAAFSGLAGRIFKTSSGRFYVPVAQDRAQILDLQRDNAVSCFIAMSSAARNAQLLKANLNRDATLSDLYIAHVFGVGQALRILRAVAVTPNKRMITMFPALDAIEPGLYAGRAKRMTLGGFVKRLTKAVRQQVHRARGKMQRRAQRSEGQTRDASSRPSNSASQRAKALVQKTNLSARDLLQRGLKMDRSGAASTDTLRSVRRFGFGVGLAARLSKPERKSSQKSLVF